MPSRSARCLPRRGSPLCFRARLRHPAGWQTTPSPHPLCKYKMKISASRCSRIERGCVSRNPGVHRPLAHREDGRSHRVGNLTVRACVRDSIYFDQRPRQNGTCRYTRAQFLRRCRTYLLPTGVVLNASEMPAPPSMRGGDMIVPSVVSLAGPGLRARFNAVSSVRSNTNWLASEAHTRCFRTPPEVFKCNYAHNLCDGYPIAIWGLLCNTAFIAVSGSPLISLREFRSFCRRRRV